MRSPSSALESELQRALETLYRIEGSPPVDAFRVGEEFLEALGVTDAREALLVHHDGEATNLALFLSRPIRAGAIGFLRDPGPSTLDAFCAALEGVSHFVYFTFAGDDRPVSRLELELQAEIDKFLFLRSVVGCEGEGLLDALYERFRLEVRDEVEVERYVVANRAARRYARWAHRAFAAGRGEAAMADARRLYRMPMTSKLAHIARAA